MSLCINPTCTQPDHPNNNTQRFCQCCGSGLLLLGRYRVMRLLSDKSGFGLVYEAYERSTPKILKVLKESYGRDLKIVELFKQEALVLGRLHHSGIPKVDEPGYFQFLPREQAEPLHCFLMEKIDGPNLLEWMHQQGNHPINEKQAINWLSQLIEVLHLVHQQHYFHRDIKPQNIMLRSSGQLVLIDFGAAREMTQTYLARLSGPGVTRISSAGYTPPEQDRGQAVPQSDFYALGRTFVFLVTGEHLLEDEVYDTDSLEGRWRKKAPHISPSLADLIDRMMAFRPFDRPRDTEEIRQALLNLKQIPAAALPHSPPTAVQSLSSTPDPSRQLSKAWVTGAIGLAIVVLGLGSHSLWQRFSGSDRSPESQVSIIPGQPLTGHTSFVNRLVFTPDGQFLVSASADKTLKVWNSETGALLRTLPGHTSFVNVLTISPDGQTIISGGADKTIRIWDLTTGRLIRTLPPYANYVNALAVSPDGEMLAGGSADKTIRIWQLATGKELRTLRGHTSFVNTIAISPDGKILASGSADKSIKLWDLKTGQELRTLTGHTSYVNALVFTPDGQTLVSGSADRTVRLWEVNTGQELKTLTSHTNYVSSLAMNPDGETLISGSADQTLKLWNLKTDQEPQTLLRYDRHIDSFAVSPDWRTIATGSGSREIKVWRMDDR
ncbi:MAG: serine/threonine-protein kinase [Leptolyngbyaceae cyanobacterium bins.59]|nr:serine/threonine-protein kinase [Leptolyngbyaceae cyanobacterium bins.59]